MSDKGKFRVGDDVRVVGVRGTVRIAEILGDKVKTVWWSEDGTRYETTFPMVDVVDIEFPKRKGGAK